MQVLERQNAKADSRFLSLIYILFLFVCVERLLIGTRVAAYAFLGVEYKMSGLSSLLLYLTAVGILFAVGVQVKLLPRVCKRVGGQDECMWFFGTLCIASILGLILDRQLAKLVLNDALSVFVYMTALPMYSYFLYILTRSLVRRYRLWKKRHGGDDWDY